jgi:hypothetical protein
MIYAFEVSSLIMKNQKTYKTPSKSPRSGRVVNTPASYS